MTGVVAGEKANAQPPEVIDSRQVGIAPGNGEPSSHKELRECAHARSGDTGEVDRPGIVSSENPRDIGRRMSVVRLLHSYAL